MSEIINEATIRVTADASGVESGLQQVDAATSKTEAGIVRVEVAAQKTGRTLENLGNLPGVRSVGEGAGAAAGQVDRATKNMADAIQRTTASMSAGARGSAEYFRSLANSRGLNAELLRPYLAQLEAVTAKTAQAAEAQRQLEASSRFLDGLRSQAEGIGKTASQLAALRAEQLGVTEAAQPLIDQLREAEQAAGDAEGSFSGFAAALAAVGVGGGVTAIAELADEYGKYIAQLELASTGQTEFLNSQAAVRRIAASAQSDLSATGSLYASIAKSTRDLGLAQRQVADITETVSLALKVSGASGSEASSAILQLSQAFASGTLRGDEFNSVNEASPRLMQALADGIGVPSGALRKMAEEGLLTTAVLSDALPRALITLRKEAASVETIAGAFTVLKNNVLVMVGATAQSSGVVSVFAGAIGLLASNLTLAAGAMGTVVAVKLGTALAASAKEALSAALASRALAASNLETARANVVATAAASSLAAARVAELRASVLAADGAVALAIATNGLIPAQARATAAAAAHTAALAKQTAAMGAASVAGGLARGALALLGGPIGAVIAVLGIAATAWAVFGESADKASDAASESVRASTEEVMEGLDKQIVKLRERNRLASIGFKPTEIQSPGEERLAELVSQIGRAAQGTDEFVNLSLEARGDILTKLQKQYTDLRAKVGEYNRESEIDANNRSMKSLGEWMEKYSTNAEKMNAEIAKAKKDLGSAFTPDLESRIRKQYEDRSKSTDKELAAYQSLIGSIKEKIQATAAEAAGLEPLSESQKLLIALDEQLASGKLKLSKDQESDYRAKVKELSINEAIIDGKKRMAKHEAEWEKIRKAHADAVTKSIADAEAEARQNEAAAETFGMSKAAIEEQTLARLEDQLAQRSSLGLTLDEIETLEKLIAAKKRSTAAMRNIEELQAQKQLWESIERTAHDTFISIFDSGKSAFDRLKDALKNGLYELLYQMTVKKWIINISSQTSGEGGLSQIAEMINGSGSGNGWLGNISSLMSVGKTIFSGFSSGLATSMGGYVTQFGNLIGSQGVSAFGTGMGLTSSQAGTAAAAYNAAGNTTVAGGLSAGSTAASVLSVAGWIAAGMAAADALYKKGFDPNNGSTNTALTNPLIPGAMHNNKIFQALGMNAQWANMFSGASVVTALFGRKNPEVREQGLEGTINASGFNGQQYAYVVEKGGVFRSDKWYTKNAALDAAQDSGLDATMQGMILAVKGFGAAMGLETSVINGYSKAIKIQLTDDEAKNQEAIGNMFAQVGDELATRLVPSIASLGKTGETAATTLQRVATNYAGVDAALSLIGKQFGQVGIQSIAARERLVDLFGSVDVLSQSMGSYAQNFLSEAERLAPTAAAVKTAMADLGLASVTTRLQFKQAVDNLVKSGALATEAGAKQFAALMSLQEAFALVTPDVDLTSQRAALTDAYNAEAQALQATVTRMGSFAASLRNLRNSALLGGLSPLSPAQKYAEARSQYEAVLAAARSGDEDAQGRYQDAYTAFLEASRVVNASSAQYQHDFAYAQAATEEAARWAEGQVDVGQAQLTALEQQVSGLIEVKQEVMSVRDAILQLNAAMGKNTAPLTAVVAPPPVAVPYSSYGTANTEALVAEVKALRTEVAGLRADQNGQTGALIAATRGAGEQTADKVAGAVKASAKTEVRVQPE